MTSPQGANEYFHVATYLPLGQWGAVFSFMRLSMQIYQHARTCDGYVAGGIRAKWWFRQFWTYTVWESRDAMLHFVHTPPHVQVIPRLREWAAPGACFAEWTSREPFGWQEALVRLQSPTRWYTPPKP